MSQDGWWDDRGQCWYIEPAHRVYEDRIREFLVIGRPGVDGIAWGYRRGHAGVWAYYPYEDDFVQLAKSSLELKDGYADGRITV